MRTNHTITSNDNEECRGMNVLLWIIQGALAFTYFAGGFYKMSKPDLLASQVPTIGLGAWRALGLVEVLAALHWMPSLTPLAAAVLAIETWSLAITFYRRYSLKLTPKNPTLWPVVMGVLVAFVAYGRYRSEEHTSELQS